MHTYFLSKEIIVVWTMLLAAELTDRRIAVNSVSPGAVATGILDDFYTAFGPDVKKAVERVGRPATAEEVAAVAIYLLTPASSWVNGIDLPIDGGIGANRFSAMLQGA